MRILWLYGAKCTLSVWKEVAFDFANEDCVYVQYPHALTKTATTIDDLAQWIKEQYAQQAFDCIIGHSMGGMLALRLVQSYGLKADKIILIESNLCPAAAFYRTLLMPNVAAHLRQQVMDMINAETPYYASALLRTLQEDFDYQELVRQIDIPIYAIYGSRGSKNREQCIRDLCLQKDVLKRLHLLFVQEAAHLPMLEQPERLFRLLKDIVYA